MRLRVLIALLASCPLFVPAPGLAQGGGEAMMEPYLFEAFSGDTVRAQVGRFRVPLNRARSGEDSLTLAFVRFPATGPNPGPPIVYLAGGPGGSGVSTARGSRFPLFMALREYGDVIALDQRGTGMSEGPDPAECPIERQYPVSEPLEWDRLRPLRLEVARLCGEFWREEGVDLSAYNTRESADDVAALAAALGSARVTLWGISYGTHLGLAVIRRHPDLVDRAILAGVEGPDHTIKLPSYWTGQLESLEELVAADPVARQEFSDLRGMIRGVLNRLERAPAPVELISADLRDTVRSSLSRFELENLTVDLLRDPSSMVRVPYLYRRMTEGDFSVVAGSSRQVGGFEAMPEAMDAASGMSSARRARFLHEDSLSLLGGGDALIDADMATAFGIPDLGEEFRAPVESEIPALFISGTLDGRTPVANAEEVLEGFPNGRHLVIENAGHSDDLFLSSPRILETMRAFLGDRAGQIFGIRVPPPDLASGRLAPSLSASTIGSITGAYERAPGDVWRVVRHRTVRSLSDGGEEVGRTTVLFVRIHGNGYPLEARSDTTFFIPGFGEDLVFRFVRDARGTVDVLEFTGSTGERSVLRRVTWEDVGFLESPAWKLAGSYELDPDQTCASPFPPERSISEASWRQARGDDGMVDFEETFGASTIGGVGYALIPILAGSERSVQLRMGTDDDARVFMDDVLVHEYTGSRTAWEAQDTVSVRLRRGPNRLLVKVCNRDSDWGFTLRITDEEGRSLVQESGAEGVRIAH